MSRNFELLSQLEADFQFAGAASKTVAAAAKAVSRATSSSSFSQEILTLVQTVFLSGGDNTPHEVVLCGVDRDSSSDSICLDIGHVLAASGSRPVCLVDANLQSPRLAHLANVAISILGPDRNCCTEVAPNLWLASLDGAVTTKQPRLAPGPELKQRFTELRTKFEFILIDAPGANAGGDAAVLSQITDGAILVIEANSTRRAAALRAKKAMEAMNVRLLGTILHNRTYPIPEALYSRL